MHNTQKAHIIVVGNEKGGAGKTTASMHIIIALLQLGFKVASMDVDSRQKSLTRYLDFRKKNMEDTGQELTYPLHSVVMPSNESVRTEASKDESNRFMQALEQAKQYGDFVVIDTPGSSTYLSCLAHSYGDTIVTPINDSFVDFDVLAEVVTDSFDVKRPGIYSEMVWKQKLVHADRDGGSTDWIVMRNRLSSLDAKNKRNMHKALSKLASRIGFRFVDGFSERVIYKELFLRGLTLSDILDEHHQVPLSISHIAARQELRFLLESLHIPHVTERLVEAKVA